MSTATSFVIMKNKQLPKCSTLKKKKQKKNWNIFTQWNNIKNREKNKKIKNK